MEEKTFEYFQTDVPQFYRDVADVFDANPNLDSIRVQLHPEAEVVTVSREDARKMVLHHKILGL